ncbi:glucan biosynthesis protein [Solimonas terrae]|uniref:Glucans biosynthesis protein D n=1 Tax=Solimonas terrae TaxID=1396819 RepID=A0A6M2BW36_9GAMM|nr:glucan biosynthesis protein D [Solimonas terrae]NGY06421.1 glucan biosynthesis protein D [Solimonas terrae]
MLSRRRFIAASTSAAALAALGLSPSALAASGLKLGKARPFSYDALIAQARALAAAGYAPPPVLSRSVLERINYEEHGKIKFRIDDALFVDGPGAYPVTFFHLGRYFQTPVHMHVLDDDAHSAREIIYDAAYFDMPADSPAHELPKGAGFAGFRFQESRYGDQKTFPWQKDDWVAFLGASYFRAIGALAQYGLSARGIALDIAEPDRPEEFPSFTNFWFVPPAKGSDRVTVYALLDGPSISGAYRFDMQRETGVVMDIACSLFLRRDVARLGLAPATSMFWFSETIKQTAIDWRPEVHDSDGLAMWAGDGERIWRPLNNPPRTMASAFSDKTPKGFGLLQRDRVFDHYQDGVYYDRRPSLWVEPLGDWGEGSVQLVEIPTDDETNDNIVAMWVPKAAARAGNEYHLKYRLHWEADEPYPTPLARCVATRLGRGGEPGKPRPQGVRKFVVEFKGAPLETLAYGVKPEAVLSASRGTFSYVFTEAVPDGVAGHWRAQFDLTVDGKEPVDMRLYLKHGDQTLSETWLYQYHPLA